VFKGKRLQLAGERAVGMNGVEEKQKEKKLCLSYL